MRRELGAETARVEQRACGKEVREEGLANS
jgi:hypothetical protein